MITCSFNYLYSFLDFSLPCAETGKLDGADVLCVSELNNLSFLGSIILLFHLTSELCNIFFVRRENEFYTCVQSYFYSSKRKSSIRNMSGHDSRRFDSSFRPSLFRYSISIIFILILFYNENTQNYNLYFISFLISLRNSFYVFFST